MNKIRITKRFTFEAGHALYGHDGKCKNIHGHSYKLYVTVIGAPITDSNSPKFGMTIDFSDLKSMVKKEIIEDFDHSIILNQNSPHMELAQALQSKEQKVVLVDYQPTIEGMVIDIANKIKKKLPANIQLHSLKLKETETSYAQWFAEDN
tara:strand:+ start:389 stop:838 length:450 start_codon:yes stop_codon:yes gene_type:complete